MKDKNPHPLYAKGRLKSIETSIRIVDRKLFKLIPIVHTDKYKECTHQGVVRGLIDLKRQLEARRKIYLKKYEEAEKKNTINPDEFVVYTRRFSKDKTYYIYPNIEAMINHLSGSDYKKENMK